VKSRIFISLWCVVVSAQFDGFVSISSQARYCILYHIVLMFFKGY